MNEIISTLLLLFFGWVAIQSSIDWNEIKKARRK